MIWFLVYILFTFVSFYILAWHCKIKCDLKEVTFDDLLYEYGPLVVCTIFPLMNVIIIIVFGGMILVEKIRHVKIL